jgi:hypothetical protein
MQRGSTIKMIERKNYMQRLKYLRIEQSLVKADSGKRSRPDEQIPVTFSPCGVGPTISRR